MVILQKSRIFTFNMVSHASRKNSALGEVFEFYTYEIQQKSLSLSDQIDKLNSHGLIIDNRELTKHYLSKYKLLSFTCLHISFSEQWRRSQSWIYPEKYSFFWYHWFILFWQRVTDIDLQCHWEDWSGCAYQDCTNLLWGYQRQQLVWR